MFGLNFNNWSKKSVAWLNNLCYAYLGLLASVQAGEIMDLMPKDLVSQPLLAKLWVVGVAAKFLVKLTNGEQKP